MDKRSNTQVTFVRKGFFAGKLFEGCDAFNYDTHASARKYAELCKQRLQAEYPCATVEIMAVEDEDVEGALPEPMQTQVLVNASDEFDTSVPLELEDTELAEVVDQVCDEVFKNFGWLVTRPILGLEEINKRHQIPISVLRWLCSNGFIEQARRSHSGWEFPVESWTEFSVEHKGIFDPGSILSVAKPQNGLVSFKSLCNEVLPANNWPASDEVWIAPADQLDELPLQIDDWTLLVDQQNVTLEHHFRASCWDLTWTYPHYAKAMVSEAKTHGVESALVEDVQMIFKSARSNVPDAPLQGAQHLARTLNLAHQDVVLVLSGGPKWKPEYEKNEDLFCREVLEPLLRRMGYCDVRYTHGQDEYGRDFVFLEETRFGERLYWAMQAKAGDVRGGANSQIDNILNQLDNAFTMEYTEPGQAPVHVAICIVAISGRFTKNAEDKIRQKMPKGIPVGAVYFWDKAKILSLIQKYW